MINISYIRLLEAFESFASAHEQIQKFGSDFPAQMPNFATEDEAYPILFISPTTSIFNRNATTFEVSVYCFDIIQKDRENINTILSDTHQIISDTYRWMLDGDLVGIDLVTASVALPIDNALLDYAAGWKMQMVFDVDAYSICEIPFSDAPSGITEVNNIVYSKWLTCDTLENCEVIQDLHATDEYLQAQIDIISGGTGTLTCENLPECEIIKTLQADVIDLEVQDGVLQDQINEINTNNTVDVTLTTSGSGVTTLVGQHLNVPTNLSQLEKITETGKTGWRLLGRDAAYYGDTGQDAVDLSNSTFNFGPYGATGLEAFASGRNTIASGQQSIAMGFLATASGNFGAMAIGNSTVAEGAQSFAAGQGTYATGDNSTALGNGSEAVGRSSMAVGQGAMANSYGEVVVGINPISLAGTAASFVSGDTAFRVGIGPSSSTRKDAFRVYKNGNIEITQAPATDNSQLNLLARNASGVLVNRSVASITSGITSPNYYVTGGTFSAQTLTLRRNDGVSVAVTGFTDVFATGLTYNNTTKALTLTQNNGNTLVASGWTDADRYITGGTYSVGAKTLALNSNSATTVTITGVTEVSQTITSGVTTTAPSENAVYAAVNEHKESYIINTAYYTGSTGTALRSVFGPTISTLTVDANTYYEFDMIINTQTNAGSNIIQLAFDGTAAYNFFTYNSSLTRAAGTIGTVQYTSYIQTNNSSNICSSLGGAINQIIVKGSFLTTTGGTITPQIGFTLSSTHNLEAGSSFIIKRKGSTAYSSNAS